MEGLCACGCGGRTKISPVTNTEKGWIRGQPRRFINGHNRRKYDAAYIMVDVATGCWNWQGSRTRYGYGQGNFPGYKGVVHRWYYESKYGPLAQGIQLDHLCRNRLCCNPEHMEPVSSRENVRRGDATILTEQQAREIKQAPRERGSGRALAARYGVHESTISAIRHGRLWPGVT